MKKLLAGISAVVMAFSLVTGTFSGSVTGLFDNLLKAEALPASVLTEEFDSFSSLTANGWLIQNLSYPIGTTTWSQGNTNFTAYSGAGYAGVRYNCGSGYATLSDWLITPELNIKNGAELSFYTRANSVAYAENLQVRMSTTGSDVGTGAESVGDFTTLLLEINPSLSKTGYPTNWTKYTVTVSGLTDEVTGRFAFRYYVTNGGPSGSNSDYIGIDSVSYAESHMPRVTFDTNGGDTANTTVIVNDDNTISFPADPAYADHTFTGWYTQAVGGELIDPAAAYATDATVYAHWLPTYEYDLLPDDSILINTYNGTDTVLAIPSSIDGYAVSGIGAGAFANKPLTEVTIPASVTNIGAGAFAGCTNLVKAKTTNKTVIIADDAFSGCPSLSLYCYEEVATNNPTLVVTYVYLYDITFHSNFGSPVNPILAVESGATITLPADPTKSYAAFLGWYTDADFQTEFNPAAAITSNLDLYAQWNSSLWPDHAAASFAGGDGSQGSPYQISNAAELALLAKGVNSGTTLNNKYFVVTADIDLSGYIWVPIAVDYSGAYFTGYFDGGNYMISNMNIQRLTGTSDDYLANYAVGLFGKASWNYGSNASVIKDIDLTIDNASVFSGMQNGGIVGLSSFYTISGCTVSGKINTVDYINNNTGGIVGDLYGGSVNNCTNNATVSSGGDYSTTGGIVGFVLASATIQNCANHAAVNGVNAIGGIFGMGSSTAALNNCYNTGNIGLASSPQNAGGIGGTFYTDPLTIRNCYSSALINGTTKGGYIGNIFTSQTDYPTHVNLTDCYFNTTLADLPEYGSIDGLSSFNQTNCEKLTTAQMQAPAFATTLQTNKNTLFSTNNSWVYNAGSYPTFGYPVTVTFHAAGATPETTVYYIPTGAYTPLPADPVVAGKVFVGWYYDEGLTQHFDAATNEIPIDTDLYARFETATIKLSQSSFVYSGEPCEPLFSTLRVNGVKFYYLDQDTIIQADPYYTVTYSDNIDAGTATVHVTLHNGGLDGMTFDKTFEITPTEIPMPVTIYNDSVDFDGWSHDITITAPIGSTITYSTTQNGTYTTTSPSFYTAGTHTIYYKITNSNYAAVSGSTTLTINPISIDGATADLDTMSYNYSGMPKTPSATVTLNSVPLVATADFDVTYENNTEVGTATATITGINNYTGTIVKTFQIVPYTITDNDIWLETDSYPYDGTAVEPELVYGSIFDSALSTADDITITYQNNNAVGEALVIITGKNKAQGTVTISYIITPPAQQVTDFTIKGIDPVMTGAVPDTTASPSSQYTIESMQWLQAQENSSDFGVVPDKFERNSTNVLGIIFKLNDGYTLNGLLTNNSYAFDLFSVAGADGLLELENDLYVNTYLINMGNGRYALYCGYTPTAPVTMVGVQMKDNGNGTYSLRYVSEIDKDDLAAASIETGFFASKTNTAPNRNAGTPLKATSAYESIINEGNTIYPDAYTDTEDTAYFITYVPGTFTAEQLTGLLYVRAYYTVGEKTTYTAVITVNLDDLKAYTDNGFPHET
ncbi:MAG: choice-of-anchor J domain-containing protein [Oscillospiraceae bacterium]